MADTPISNTGSTCAQLQRRITELETFLTLRSGQCAQAVAALTQVIHIAGQIANDPAVSSQSAIDAVRLRLSAASVIELLADGIGHVGDSVVLRDAIEAAQGMLASGVPSSASMH